MKGQGAQGGGVFDPPNEGSSSENTSIDGRVVWNTPRGGATDPPPHSSDQQGMDGGSNMSIPQIKFTDRPEKTVNLPSTSFDVNLAIWEAIFLQISRRSAMP